MIFINTVNLTQNSDHEYSALYDFVYKTTRKEKLKIKPFEIEFGSKFNWNYKVIRYFL